MRPRDAVPQFDPHAALRRDAAAHAAKMARRASTAEALERRAAAIRAPTPTPAPARASVSTVPKAVRELRAAYRRTLSSNRMERRTIEARANGDSTTLTGYGAVFGAQSEDLGGFVEVIARDAFDGVLATNPDVRCLYNHLESAVLGRTASGTLRVSVDDTGLRYECSLPRTQLAADVAESVKRGDISESSFSFVAGEDRWTEQPDGSVLRTVLRVDALFDVSPVTFAAYSATSATA